MQWYYVKDGQRAGPIEDGPFRQMAAEGVVEPATLVWNADLPDWQPWASAAGGEATITTPPAMATCIECGISLPSDAMIVFRETHICGGCKALFFRRVKQGTASFSELAYAGLGRRLAAKIIDWVICGTLQASLQGALLHLLGNTDPLLRIYASTTLAGLFSLVLIIVYGTLFVGRFGATPGKMALGLRIVDGAGSRISYARALGRAFAEILSGCSMYVGYLLPLFDQERRCLHDFICNTRVVEAGPWEEPLL